MFKRKPKQNEEYLEIKESMRGSLEFKNPIQLVISGDFEGSLSMKGTLTIGESASVNATIEADAIFIFGTFSGEITANKEIRLMKTSRVDATITTGSIYIEQGAVFNGTCKVVKEEYVEDNEPLSERILNDEFFDIEALSSYLEIDKDELLDWARSGKIPCISELDGSIRFKKQDIERWVEDNILR